MLPILDRAVVFAVDFKPRVVNGVSVMPNHGRAAGAPPWLTLGDGTTATTFPTPLAGFGATFDGGDYVNTGVVDIVDVSNTYWLYFLGSVKARSAAHEIISSRIAANNYTGISLYATSSQVELIHTANLPASNANRFIATSSKIGFSSLASSYTGNPNESSSCSIYVNGLLKPITLSGEISATIKSGNQFVLGSRSSTVSLREAYMLGTCYAFGIGHGIITAQDISQLDALVRGGIR